MFDQLAPRLRTASLLGLMALSPAAFAQDSGPAMNTESFQDWDVNCPVSASDGNCAMTQMAKDASGEPVLQVVVGNPPQLDSAAITFLTPLGVRLAPGLQLQVDSNEPIGMPYQVCLPQGCRADLPIRPQLLNQLKGGSTATVSMIDPNSQRVDVDVSLMGFSAAKQRIDRN
ncbi:MAG: invasion associated locus B family protein [Halomonas sp.]|nr:invasion associated locus B family protein [Halomonas sp.]MDN6296783.1 invasion associated locus B family protein [Halomonas sp.]MDN6314057.1 invasion associated locus B family protein [Halomonas sp.]MDN6335399.1 invasion associated locus B family protein [Halomonas sp.]